MTRSSTSTRALRRAFGATALALSAIAGTLAVAPAAGATPTAPGVIGVLPTSANAGQTSLGFAFGYAAAAQPVKGTLTVQVPAGFSTPQAQAPLKPGYVFTVSLCRQFKITGIAGGPGGSSVVSIAVDSAARQGGVLSYVQVKAPTQPGSYPFPSAVTQTGAPTSLTPTPTVTVTGRTPTTTDLAVTQSVDTTTPHYRSTVTFTTVVRNLSTATASGVTVGVPLPGGVQFLGGPGGYDPTTGTWTVGPLAGGAQATLVVTARAGAVAAGDQTVTATVRSTTTDPNPANDTASVTEHSVRETIEVILVPDPNNPPIVDISAPGTIGWMTLPFAPHDPEQIFSPGTTTFLCETVSANPCPEGQVGAPFPFTATFALVMSQLGVDTYTVTAIYTPDDSSNYETGTGSVTFTTSNSGGD